ncbi:MAG: LytR/AlgR family response regulator transcription factor [Saprospiraceae bacterium]
MLKTTRVLLVEDEFITLDNLREVVEELGYEVAGTAMKADAALQILQSTFVDLVLLDIDLKNSQSGIWLAQQIRADFQIPFIFLTALSDRKTINEVATLRPYGYIVKPFTKDNIFATIELVLKNYAAENTESVEKDYVFLKEDKEYKKVRLAEIKFVQAYRNYLEVTVSDNRYVIRSTLKDFIQQLPIDQFIQTHRSFVVNRFAVEKISAEGLHLAGRVIPISRKYSEEVVRHFPI